MIQAYRGAATISSRKHSLIDSQGAISARAQPNGPTRIPDRQATTQSLSPDLMPWRGSWTDAKSEPAKLDFIGDVHGCASELEALLNKLGYAVHWSEGEAGRSVEIVNPPGRKAVLLGDLVDRGPRIADTIRIADSFVRSKRGYAILGNHDLRLLRVMRGEGGPDKHGNHTASLQQLDREPPEYRARVTEFLAELPSYIVFDQGRVLAAHAGLEEHLIGADSAKAHRFAMLGRYPGEDESPTHEPDPHWSTNYRGATAVLYGHYQVREAQWINNTMCLDTSCVNGGKLTALRWPERSLESVPSRESYAQNKPLRRPIPQGAELFV